MKFIFLSGQDSIEVAVKTMKYGAYDYIVKDKLALKKLVARINQIRSTTQITRSKRIFKSGVVLFFIALAVFILVMTTIAIMYPKTFGLGS